MEDVDGETYCHFCGKIPAHSNVKFPSFRQKAKNRPEDGRASVVACAISNNCLEKYLT
jgi:hypothetical protein